MELITKYEAFYEEKQRSRWQEYGAPYTPHPEQDRLNKAMTELTKRTQIEKIEIKQSPSDGKKIKAVQKCVKKAVDKLQKGKETRRATMAVIPMLQKEVKEYLITRQNEDEAGAIQFLAENITEPSMAGKIYREWKLTRKIIKDCQAKMARNRAWQVTFNNLVGGTRFKALQGSKMVRTRCPRKGCEELDSWEHFKECHEAHMPDGLSEKERISWIVEISKKAMTENPARPCPTVIPYHEQ